MNMIGPKATMEFNRVIDRPAKDTLVGLVTPGFGETVHKVPGPSLREAIAAGVLANLLTPVAAPWWRFWNQNPVTMDTQVASALAMDAAVFLLMRCESEKHARALEALEGRKP